MWRLATCGHGLKRSVVTVCYSGNPLLRRANLLTTPDIFMESRTDFSADIRTKFSSLSDPIDALTADFTKSTLLCARSQEADVTAMLAEKRLNHKSFCTLHCALVPPFWMLCFAGLAAGPMQ